MSTTKRVPAKVKYLLLPGYVGSRNDRDTHYISAAQLAFLYRVRPDTCYTLISKLHGLGAAARAELADLIVLEPKFDGDYTMPVKRVRDLIT